MAFVSQPPTNADDSTTEKNGDVLGVKDGGIGTTQLAALAVTAAKLAADAVETAKILNAAVTEAKIADGAITNAKVAAAAGIVESKLAAAVQAKLVTNPVAGASSGRTVVGGTDTESGSTARSLATGLSSIDGVTLTVLDATPGSYFAVITSIAGGTVNYQVYNVGGGGFTTSSLTVHFVAVGAA